MRTATNLTTIPPSFKSTDARWTEVKRLLAAARRHPGDIEHMEAAVDAWRAYWAEFKEAVEAAPSLSR